jgi:hypothetical protein
MMKGFMTSGALSKGKEPEGDPGEKGMMPFPGEEVVMMIYGCPAPLPPKGRCMTNLSPDSLTRCS